MSYSFFVYNSFFFKECFRQTVCVHSIGTVHTRFYSIEDAKDLLISYDAHVYLFFVDDRFFNATMFFQPRKVSVCSVLCVGFHRALHFCKTVGKKISPCI
jgi:hypothetical protein